MSAQRQCTATWLGLLHDITTIANESDQLERTLGLALQLICDATGWPLGQALTRTAEDTLESTGVWYRSNAYLSAATHPLHQIGAAEAFAAATDLPKQVLANGTPHWIADIKPDNHFPHAKRLLNAGLHASFAFPLRAKGNVIAVLVFYAETPQTPDTALLEVMGQIGVQLGRVFERERAARALTAREKATRQILDTAADAFIGMDAEGCITEWNRAATTLFGWSAEDIIGRRVAETIIPTVYRAAHDQGLQRYLKTGATRILGQTRELSAVRRDGHEFPIELTLWSLDSAGTTGFYGFLRDITERKQHERALQKHAYHDALTHLPNRKFLLNKLDELLDSRQAGHYGPTLIFIDLDHFKRVNDSLGHATGDLVLKAISQRLLALVRPADLVARVVGDEFVILCPDLADARAASLVAERLLQSLSEPLQTEGDSLFLTASIGIASADIESDSAEALLNAADTAAYHAKRTGRSLVEVFDDKMRRDMASRLQIENELRSALTNNEFCLHFQPIVSAIDGSMTAMEALIRWNHPNRGLLQPMEFIPIAEETGLIVPMGEWILAEACRCAERWAGSAVGHAPLHVSINLSARQLAQSNLVPQVAEILASAAVDPERIQFGIEVTETVVMRDPALAAQTLRELKSLGVHLSIDDFGTGYSSLSYLKHFPVDTVKIDRSFVWGLVDNPADLAIVQAVTHLARSLELSVVAEGVETEEQAEALREAGVDQFQGFLYARPQPPEELMRAAWVQAHRAPPADSRRPRAASYVSLPAKDLVH